MTANRKETVGERVWSLQGRTISKKRQTDRQRPLPRNTE